MNDDLASREPIADQLRRISADAPPGLMSRAVASAEGAPRFNAGLISAIGAATFVVLAAGALGLTLRGTGSSSPRHRDVPVAVSSPAVTSAPADIPQDDLVAAKLTNVANLVTGYDLVSTGGGVQGRLLGAYSDAARTVFLVRMSGATPGQLFVSVSDDAGSLNSATNQLTTPNGDRIFVFDAPLRPMSGDTTAVALHVSFATLPSGSTGGSVSTVPGPSFDFRLKVQSGRVVSPSASATTPGARFVFQPVIITPNAVDVNIDETGASIDGLTAGPRSDAISVIGPNGQATSLLDLRYSVNVPKSDLNQSTARDVRIHLAWMKSVAGVYRVKFNFGQGRSFERTITIS